MSSRAGRAVLFALAATLLLSLFWKGRGISHVETAAFLRYTTGKVLIRLDGDVEHGGIRQFNDGARVSDVIKMTIPGRHYCLTGNSRKAEAMKNGEALHFLRLSEDNYAVTLRSTSASERILFQIPLDPALMGYDDWLSLPGIGPKLAELIVQDSQNNGDFGSLAAVGRVPGVGVRKLATIGKYFK